MPVVRMVIKKFKSFLKYQYVAHVNTFNTVVLVYDGTKLHVFVYLYLQDKQECKSE